MRAAAAAAPDPTAAGQEAIPRVRAELAGRMFILKVGTSLWDRSERRLHLCQDGFAGDYWNWIFHGNTGSGRTEGSWEVAGATYTGTTATARVRLLHPDGETFRTIVMEGGRVPIGALLTLGILQPAHRGQRFAARVRGARARRKGSAGAPVSSRGMPATARQRGT